MTPRLYEQCTRCGHPYANHSRTRWGRDPWSWVHMAPLASASDCVRCDCPKFTLKADLPTPSRMGMTGEAGS